MLSEPKEEPLDSSVFKTYSLLASILVSVKLKIVALDLIWLQRLLPNSQRELGESFRRELTLRLIKLSANIH